MTRKLYICSINLFKSGSCLQIQVKSTGLSQKEKNFEELKDYCTYLDQRPSIFIFSNLSVLMNELKESFILK